MKIKDFNHTIDHWIKELEQYTFARLCAKPSPESWSLGQMYLHLIDDAKFYIEQIEMCIASNDHAAEEASPAGKAMLLENGFPDIALEGAPSNAFIPQPESKERLMSDLLNLRSDMNRVAAKMSRSPFKGKTKHPGLNYFSADEWLQFADIHFRHHLRQKKRIENLLNINSEA
jgi:hypothetical protein